MKNLIKISAVLGLALTLTSCGTTNDVYGNNRYPTNNNGVYRAPDGNVYRQGEIYRDRNGNVYQNGRVVQRDAVYGRPGVVARKGNTGYSKNTARRNAPGQMKKIYGGNARDYAPGHNKSRNNAYRKDVRKQQNRKFNDKRYQDKHHRHEHGKKPASDK